MGIPLQSICHLRFQAPVALAIHFDSPHSHFAMAAQPSAPPPMKCSIVSGPACLPASNLLLASFHADSSNSAARYEDVTMGKAEVRMAATGNSAELAFVEEKEAHPPRLPSTCCSFLSEYQYTRNNRAEKKDVHFCSGSDRRPKKAPTS